jgi:glycosyltransferase involved in cell wall biosynthesis
LVPVKGFDILIEAFARIASDFPDVRLIIAGEGPERAALSALADRLCIGDRVDLPGWLPEPGDIMAHAKMFVLSSRYEGFPNALIEAMSCGMPVISTASIGALEIITHEVDGLLVPVDAVSQLAHAMKRLLTNSSLRERLARNARGVSTRYSIDAIVPMWDAVIEDGAAAGAVAAAGHAATQR